MHKICPACGADSREKKFAGAFCESCFLKKVPLSCPGKISIEKCRSCGRVRVRGEWIAPGKKELEGFIAGKCKSSAEIVSSRAASPLESGPVEMAFVLKAGPSFLEASRAIELEFLPVTCPDCSRRSGGYYEAIIQFRGDREKAGKAFRRLSRLLEKKTFISRVSENKEGTDAYVGSSRAAQEAISELGYSATVSLKLAGLREGKRIYRATYCIRL